MIYKVEITETYQRTVEIEAKEAVEAERLVRGSYRNGDVVLDADYFISAEIRLLD